MPEAALGTAPAGAGIENVGSSTVSGVSPTLLPPGSPFDLCFTVFVQSPDAEYLDHLDIDLPDNWIVNSVAANSVPPANGCSGALPPVVGVNAGNVVYWQSTGYPPQTGCGAWSGGSGGASFSFCANVTVPDCTGEPWSFPWNYIGDGYGGTPHSVAGTVGPAGCLQPGVYLTPEAMPAGGCSGAPQVHTFQLLNNTGADGNFSMTYSVPTANGTLTGPPVVQAASGATVPFDVILTPDQCLQPGGTVIGLIEAAGNGYTDQSTINKTVLSAFWNQIASEPNNGRMDNVLGAWNDLAWSITGYGADANVRTYDPATNSWAVVGTPAPFGINYARSGCQFNDVVVMYGDAATAGFTGLWAYDMGASLWNNLTPSGTAPPQTGIWAPAWAADPETGYCYMTGGATTPGAGNLSTVYVYDPGGNAWLAPLPNFGSVRDFHAAFIFRRPADNHKLLCVVGGNNGASMTSTQCYDFDTGVWNAENADMGALPTDLWAMGYAVKRHAGTDPQLWLTAGVNGGSISTATEYYDVNSGTWQPGGSLVSGAVYRTAAVTLNNEVYHLSGSVGSFTYTGLSDRHIQCPVCLYEWAKYINGEPWTPGISITLQTSDTLQVTEIVTTALPFTLLENWNPNHLRLLGWEVSPGGMVVTGTGFLEWHQPPGGPGPWYIIKWFHIEPCNWTETVLDEVLSVDQQQPEPRPVLILKLPPELWIDAAGGGPVLAGQVVSFTLLYSNTGGYENGVMIRNDFPPGANFANAYPYPDRWDEQNALWAEWDIGDLPMGGEGSIEVAVYIAPTAQPSTTFEIWDYIIDHIGEPRDAVSILFHVEPPPHRYIYLPVVYRNYLAQP